MAVGGLDYSIRKKLDTQYLRDMAQLADWVRQVERLKVEKVRVNKGKKEHVAYVNLEDKDLASHVEYNHVKEMGVDVSELKSGPPYVCKFLTPTNGKNHSELEKNDKFSKRAYTFDVTKCDKIFDLLVVDGQVLVSPNSKVPPLEQRKKQGFCKYHNLLGHKTSQCFLFRDLVQNSLNEGMLKFAKGKIQMKIDSDLLQVEDVGYVEQMEINSVEIIEDFDMDEFEDSESRIQVVYLKDGEGLVEFLRRCKLKTHR